MGCCQTTAAEPEEVLETKPAPILDRRRSPTPDKEIADAGTLFSIMATSANDVFLSVDET
jgi:hypothetical protein